MFYWHNADFEFYEAPPLPTFANATDAELAQMLAKHYADEIDLSTIEGWEVGATRKIHLDSMQAPNPNSSETLPAQYITVVIVDHDHTDLATPINGHTKAALTVQTRECLNDNTSARGQVGHIYVNGDNSYDMTFTGWSNLYMRTYLKNTVWGAFPSSLKDIIKPSKHYRHITYNTSVSGSQVTDNLFLPSYPEIFGTANYSNYTPTNPVEGTQFEYYQTSSNRIKYGNDINNGAPNRYNPQNWWSGSTSSGYDSSYGYRWCYVNTGGAKSDSNGVGAFALAPAFAM